jgi:hypothetical protein
MTAFFNYLTYSIMKILLSLFATLMLLVSCSSDEELVVSADNQQTLSDNMVQFATFSAQDNEEIRLKLTDFYQVATVNNCDPGNFGIVTPTEALEYMTDLGFTSVRAFHNWTVDYGTTLRNITLDNPDMDGSQVVELVTTDTYNAISSTGSPCGLQMAQAFNQRALRMANFYSVYVQGEGFRQVEDNDLFLFGGAFNTFIQAQELEFACNNDR